MDRTKQALVGLKLERDETLAPEVVKELKRRKLVEERHRNVYIIRKGKSYREKRENVKT